MSAYNFSKFFLVYTRMVKQVMSLREYGQFKGMRLNWRLCYLLPVLVKELNALV